jgi:hypothetical protein
LQFWAVSGPEVTPLTGEPSQKGKKLKQTIQNGYMSQSLRTKRTETVAMLAADNVSFVAAGFERPVFTFWFLANLTSQLSAQQINTLKSKPRENSAWHRQVFTIC